MSRPYIKLNSATYSSGVLSLDLTYLRIRGTGSMTLDGFSQSISISTGQNGYGTGSVTYSVGTLGTSSTTTYATASSTISFSGTASVNDNIKITIAASHILGSGNGGYTFSATSSTATALNTLVGAMTFASNAAGYSATTSGSTIVFSGPASTGISINGVSMVTTLAVGTTSTTFTFSATGSFTGGSTLNNLVLNSPSQFGFSDDSYTFTV